MSTERILWLDNAKGIGILLVIIGHCIFICHPLIDVFHMPLFFCLSGLTFSVKHTLKDFFVKKVDRIMVPFIFFSIISGLLSLIPRNYGGIFNAPIWFLQTIFGALLMMRLSVKWPKNIRYIIVSIALSVFLLSLYYPIVQQVQPFSICRICIAYIYIYIWHGNLNLYL